MLLLPRGTDGCLTVRARGDCGRSQLTDLKEGRLVGGRELGEDPLLPSPQDREGPGQATLGQVEEIQRL